MRIIIDMRLHFRICFCLQAEKDYKKHLHDPITLLQNCL